MNCSKCLGHMRAQKTKPTNFCDTCIEESVTMRCVHNSYYVYKLVAKNRKTLYVGYTATPLKRFKQHMNSKKFWSMVVLKSFDREEAAQAYEGELLHKWKPPLNVVCTFKPVKSGQTVAPQLPTPRAETSDFEGLNVRLQTETAYHVTYCKPCYYSGFSLRSDLS